MKYNPLPLHWSKSDIEEVIARGDPKELLYVPLVVAMNPPSRVYAEQICLQFATHHDPNVRGLALEGFGHIARIFRSLNQRLIQPIIEAGLRDEDEWVRGKADEAASDIEWYVGWVFSGREDRRGQRICDPRRR